MNNSLLSTCLRRQARTRTRRLHTQQHVATLQMIPELDEDAASSSSRASSPAPRSVKASRRQGNVKLSDIRIVKDIDVSCGSGEERWLSWALEGYGEFDLCSPRPAPSPPSSPSSHSSTSPSPSSPSTSDEEDFFAAQQLQRILPLSITKINRSLSQEPQSVAEQQRESDDTDEDDFDVSAYYSSPSSDDESSDDEAGYYTRELQDILTLFPLSASSTPSPTTIARPESMIFPLYTSTGEKRVSRPLPTPPRSSSPSPSPTSSKRSSTGRTYVIPSRPPPPPPTHQRRRPPPRVSVPSDFDLAYDFGFDDATSPFPPSPLSIVTPPSPSPSDQSDVDVDFPLADMDIRFEFDVDTDHPLCFPESLPVTPVSPATFDDYHDDEYALDSTHQDSDLLPPSQMLKSRWSSSTLSSTYSQHSPASSKHKKKHSRSGSVLSASKLKLYFSSGGRKSLDAMPSTPRTPMSPRMASGSRVPSTPSTPRTPLSYRYESPPPAAHRPAHTHTPHTSIPHAHIHTPEYATRKIRRSASVTSHHSLSSSSSCSSSGCSDVSSGSSSGSGLRRKPIPVEMFLRN
ncbi:hypothetical protein BDN71DRAFT_101694 [Pleurotus eryngii]|uniref:Uncharacterized protein n=1 Tax=Pleurotus eryngii TaxID=5323 RepID=A0A9P5ZN47_PLEER|nr:hypothetical protein BDN71DRAFT_101694 [Pleurotus eryngii]